jgi:hypothetical protein
MGGAWYVVEANHLSDAIDELVESERFGHELVIPEEDYGRYGMEFSAADFAANFPNKPPATQGGWVDLEGTWFANQGNLAEYKISANGVFYDDDHLYYWGEENCRPGEMPYEARYFHPDLPEEGVLATEFYTNQDYADFEWDNEKPKVSGHQP